MFGWFGKKKSAATQPQGAVLAPKAQKCRRAIAYLKPKIDDESAEPPVKLSPEESPVLRDLGNGLLVAYVVDDGNSFQYIQHRHLLEEQISESDLNEMALANLKQLADEKLQIKDFGEVYGVFLDGNFEASVLLLDGLWDKGIRHLVKEGFVACVPARDILAFCDCGSETGIARLRTMVESVWPRADHQISRSLYVRRAGSWQKHAG